MSKRKKLIAIIVAVALVLIIYRIMWAFWAIHKSKITLKQANISASITDEPNLSCIVYEVDNPKDLLVTVRKSSTIDAYRLNLLSKKYYPVYFFHHDRHGRITVQSIDSYKDVYQFDCNEQDGNSVAIIFGGSKCSMADELPIFKKQVVLRRVR